MMPRFFTFFCIFAVVCVFVFAQLSVHAVAENLDEAVSENAPPASFYVLRSGDKISAFVYGEKELSGRYEVGVDGTIVFPLIGSVRVGGLSLDQATDVLESRLRDGYLVDPSIVLTIAEHRPVYVLGEVRAPGSYAYSANMSALNLVALAGGYTYRANRRDVEILRSTRENISSTYEKMPVQSAVEPGDIVLIKERFF